MVTTVIKTIGSDVGRDYATRKAWSDDFGVGLPSDITAATGTDEKHIGRLFNDNGTGNAADTGNAQINPSVTVDGSTDNYLQLEADPTDPFIPGDPSSITNHRGVYCSQPGGVMRVQVNDFRVKNIGFISTATTSTFLLRCIRVDNLRAIVENCYFEMQGGTNAQNSGIENNSAGLLTVINCLARGDNDGTAAGRGMRNGFYDGTNSGNITCYNCGAFGVKADLNTSSPFQTFGRGFRTNSSSSILRNCWAFNSGSNDAAEGDFVTVASTTEDHNASGDNTATGTGHLSNQSVAAFLVFPSIGLFLLEDGSNGNNAGVDLTSPWPVSPVEDFIEVAHDFDTLGWDMGPYQFNGPYIASGTVVFSGLTVAGSLVQAFTASGRVNLPVLTVAGNMTQVFIASGIIALSQITIQGAIFIGTRGSCTALDASRSTVTALGSSRKIVSALGGAYDQVTALGASRAARTDLSAGRKVRTDLEANREIC